jgi:hypothetical protein
MVRSDSHLDEWMTDTDTRLALPFVDMPYCDVVSRLGSAEVSVRMLADSQDSRSEIANLREAVTKLTKDTSEAVTKLTKDMVASFTRFVGEFLNP